MNSRSKTAEEVAATDALASSAEEIRQDCDENPEVPIMEQIRQEEKADDARYANLPEHEEYTHEEDHEEAGGCDCGGEGCPMCKECGGQYSPGTEECDMCEHSDECSADDSIQDPCENCANYSEDPGEDECNGETNPCEEKRAYDERNNSDEQTNLFDASASIPATQETVIIDLPMSDVFTHPLPVFLTDVELDCYSEEQARLFRLYMETEEKKKAANKAFNDQIKDIRKKLDEISTIVEEGSAERPVECRWQFDYNHGIKRLIRLDKNTCVEEKPLTKEEIEKGVQLPLFDNQKAKNSIAAVEECFGPGSASVPVEELAERLGGDNEGTTVSDGSATVEESVQFDGRHCQNDCCEHFRDDRPWNCGAGSIDGALVIESCGDYLSKRPEDHVADAGKVIDPEMEEAVNIAEEAAFAKKQPDLPIDPNRKCCYPHDRDIKMDGNIRVMYCRVCGLIAKKEDYSDVSNVVLVPFIVGERVEVSP